MVYFTTIGLCRKGQLRVSCITKTTQSSGAYYLKAAKDEKQIKINN